MPAYKDEKTGTWYCSFPYKDWNGDRKRKLKRGFARKKDALEWEHFFLSKTKVSCNISFEALSQLYFEDMETRLKKTTITNKRYLFDTKILPFFGNLKIDKITAAHIRRFQNKLVGDEKEYAPTYLRTINNQLSAVFNYAVKYYNLPANPCHLAGSMGKKNADEMQIWTVDQFKQAMQYCKREDSRLAFEIMFYAGLRIGEVLALTPADILNTKTISITKGLAHIGSEKIISTPKTSKSIREIPIPSFLYERIQEYIQTIYDGTPDTPLFTYAKGVLNRNLTACAKDAELPHIRVHDLRHSHASLLIEMGYNILLVSERLGHEKVETTWNTYAHIYPNKQEKLAESLDRFR